MSTFLIEDDRRRLYVAAFCGGMGTGLPPKSRAIQIDTPYRSAIAGVAVLTLDELKEVYEAALQHYGEEAMRQEGSPE